MLRIRLGTTSMPNQDEVRGASLSNPLPSGFKLPMLLTARPGNVGVQIDAHRAMNIFTHPRSVKFTSQFHGGMYENGSLENYSRVVERTAQRARLLQDKLDKLQHWEQYLLEDDAKRKQRRIEREAARQRRVWQMHQAAKRADERAQETAAAVTVQRVVRGFLARRIASVLRQVLKTNEAASMLQRAMKVYTARQQLVHEQERRAREDDERYELKMHSAATVVQRQARKHLKIVQETREQALAACVEDEEDENEEEEEETASASDAPPPPSEFSTNEKIATDDLSRGISLDLLFSDEENECNSTKSTSSSSIPPIEPPITQRILPQPPVSNGTTVGRPRRPMAIKRVGGGYRTKLLPHPTKTSEQEVVTSNSAPATPRTTPGRVQPQGSEATPSSLSEEFLPHSRRSPTIPKAAFAPTFAATPNLTARPTPAAQKNDNDQLRAASPVKPTVSPYAIPQRLH